jgi:hypothetical protein
MRCSPRKANVLVQARGSRRLSGGRLEAARPRPEGLVSSGLVWPQRIRGGWCPAERSRFCCPASRLRTRGRGLPRWERRGSWGKAETIRTVISRRAEGTRARDRGQRCCENPKSSSLVPRAPSRKESFRVFWDHARRLPQGSCARAYCSTVGATLTFGEK